jgi:hypothetical protein
MCRRIRFSQDDCGIGGLADINHTARPRGTVPPCVKPQLVTKQNKGEIKKVTLIHMLHHIATHGMNLAHLFGDDARDGIGGHYMATGDVYHPHERVQKAGTSLKTDVGFRLRGGGGGGGGCEYRTSVKHIGAGMASSCNHTPRNAKVFRHGGALSQDVPTLDIIVGEYKRRREQRLIPNEDFGRPNKPSGAHFQSTFHIREYSIWATFI